MAVHAVLFNGDAEHLACGCAVNVAAVLEHLQPPFLPGKPCNHPGLNGGKVRHDEFPAVLRHKRRSDELRERVGDILVEQFQSVIIPALHQCPCLRQVRDMVLRQVLKLDYASAVPPGAIGSIKLEHPMRAAVGTYRILHRRVFLDR